MNAVFRMIRRLYERLRRRMRRGRIADILDADHANSQVAPDLIANLHPDALTLFQHTADLFQNLLHRLHEWPAENVVDQKLRQMARELGVTDQELAQRLTADPTAPDIAKASDSWAQLCAFRMSRLVVLGIHRHWGWAATDLHRFRVTPAIGYLRLEAEGVGWLKLFTDDAAIAERWSALKSRSEGKKFFRETQSNLKTAVRGYDLADVYDIASAGAQHVGMAGIVRGLDNRHGQLRLPDQELDPEDPYSFHLAVAHFHRIQSRILHAIADALPDAKADGWNDAFRAYSDRVDLVWNTMSARYAEQIQAHREA